MTATEENEERSLALAKLPILSSRSQAYDGVGVFLTTPLGGPDRFGAVRTTSFAVSGTLFVDTVPQPA